MIDLSIIIVNYNDLRFLPDCLGSIFSAAHKIIFEVIFVDNNSTDGSVDFVKKNYPMAKIIENGKNLGFCGGNNKGLAVFAGRYALLLNTDTVIRENALDQMVEYMDEHPQVGACGPKLLNTNGTPQHQGGMFNQHFWLSDKPVNVDYVIGAAIMARKETIEKVGELDENFFFSNDDLDWCRRIRKAGWDVCFLPQAEIIHHGGFTIKHFNERLFVEGFRGGLYFAKKHYGLFVYQIYRILLGLIILEALFVGITILPFLKNKGKIRAFYKIILICIKGNVIASYK